ncbi:hypothetical protein [Nocardioides sp. CFH 31398]|uniref:hypothetical protein n=1 Tax=Nocardioides sp. CFH 31398 TaxID=2919579 RepID=UPI001F0675AC|nr:hypothetical protein [Nocardioides sp. CFH 31398]MCH1869037.1 hypothetical protein [Nocardioides sp. CFH 31398]
MSQPRPFRLSRAMSVLTAGYAVYALARPRHLGSALDAEPRAAEGWDEVARVFGVRDLVVSGVALLGREPATVRTAMRVRIGLDAADGLLLASRVGDPGVRAKVLGVTLGWAALNALALRADRRRDRA